MVDASSNGGQAQPTAAPNQQPGIHVLGQYVKDLSFENPNAPRSLRPSDKAPKLDVNVNVNAKPQSETDFEIDLKLEAKATRGEDTLFPFARQIIADATRQGGFPPLMIDPVDFAALYRQRMAELNVQRAASQQS